MAWAVYLVPDAEFDLAEFPPGVTIRQFDPDTTMVAEPIAPNSTLDPALNTHQVAIVRNLAALDRLLRIP